MRAVVVGSGFGGLAAAIRLASAGHEVTILEKRDRIGGRAYQYQLEGFQFDGGPTVLTAPFMFEELFTLAGERMSDHVSLVPLDPFYRAFDADGRAFDYHASDAAMLAEVAARSPSDVSRLPAARTADQRDLRRVLPLHRAADDAAAGHARDAALPAAASRDA